MNVNQKIKNIISKLFRKYIINNIEYDSESIDYNGCDFILSFDNISKQIKFRTGKLTPNKLGHFISCWKRDLVSNKTIPYDSIDSFDFLIVYIQDKEGIFIFPKSVLIDKEILTNSSFKNKNGKRGFRLYAPWIKLTSKQAIDTQSWQSNFYFKNISDFVAKYTTKII